MFGISNSNKNEEVPRNMSTVSGHNKIFSLPNGRVCSKRESFIQIAKPYSSNERKCYKIAFQEESRLTRYIPKYFGSVSIEVVILSVFILQDTPEIQNHLEEESTSILQSTDHNSYPHTPYDFFCLMHDHFMSQITRRT